MATCVICQCELSDEKIKHVHIKGKTKNVCPGCVAAIKGLA